MGIVVGLIVTLSCLLGGFVAMGGHLGVLVQPFEYVIILGSSIGTFLVANPTKVVKDTGKAVKEAFANKVPTQNDYLKVLALLHQLMREMRSKSRGEVEAHIDEPKESPIFQAYPELMKDESLVHFICDYCRLIIIGNARPHEIEALMEQEISTIKKHKAKPYSAVSSVAEALPAIGICAAVLGIVKAMGAIDQSPEILGHYIGSALIGTFVGIFSSYAMLSPLATKIKTTREKQCQPYIIVKQTLIAYMNGALPQIALEHGRKTISAAERPTIDDVESDSIANIPGSGAGLQQAA
jgi:chemotaxis protein MotA